MTLTGEELTDLERRLRDETAAGGRLDLRVGTPAVDDPAKGASWGSDRTISARVLYDMLTEEGQAGGQPRVLSLVGARIVEPLDFEGAVTDWRVVFEGCSFAEPVVLAQAKVLMIVLARCHLPALDAQQAHIRGNFLLKYGLVNDGICLAGAHIDGVLDLNGTTLIGRDTPALQGDMVTVGQNMTCLDGFTTQGAFHLPGARIGGQLNLTGARFSNPGQLALGADRLTVEHDMICRELATQGEVRLVGAHISGQLDLEGAIFDQTRGSVLHLDALRTSDLRLCFARPPSRVTLTHAHVGAFVDAPDHWPPALGLVGFTYDALHEKPAVPVRKRLEWLGGPPPGRWTPGLCGRGQW